MDVRVCGILSIPDARRNCHVCDGAGGWPIAYGPADKCSVCNGAGIRLFPPAVSADPACIPIVMEGISDIDHKRRVDKWKSDYGSEPKWVDVCPMIVCLKYLPRGGDAKYWAQIGHDDDSVKAERGTTPNHALCLLAIALETR